MSGRSNHVWGGVVFIATCIFISVVIYLAATRSRSVEGTASANQPSLQPEVGTETEQPASPATVEDNAGRSTASDDNEQRDLPNARPTMMDKPSVCEGYWLGDGFAVSLITTGAGSTVSLWRDEKSRYANPLTAEVARNFRDDASGTYDNKHVQASFANIASVSLTCDADQADDDEGGRMSRVDQASFQLTTAGWPQ